MLTCQLYPSHPPALSLCTTAGLLSTTCAVTRDEIKSLIPLCRGCFFFILLLKFATTKKNSVSRFIKMLVNQLARTSWKVVQLPSILAV